MQSKMKSYADGMVLTVLNPQKYQNMFEYIEEFGFKMFIERTECSATTDPVKYLGINVIRQN